MTRRVCAAAAGSTTFASISASSATWTSSSRSSSPSRLSASRARLGPPSGPRRRPTSDRVLPVGSQQPDEGDGLALLLRWALVRHSRRLPRSAPGFAMHAMICRGANVGTAARRTTWPTRGSTEDHRRRCGRDRSRPVDRQAGRPGAGHAGARAVARAGQRGDHRGVGMRSGHLPGGLGPAGEFAQFLSGHVTCRSDDGDAFQLREGDAMTFVPGWSGEWTAHSRLRKIYCTFVPGSR